jgi:hypothetical protein
MGTIRCKNCNLVNFSTEPQCKRCKQPLSEYSDFADQRQYQTSFEQSYQSPPNQKQTSPFQPYQMPPPPNFHEEQFPGTMQMSCIKCGGRNRVSLQHFKKDYIPPYLYIAFFMGVLPGLILIALLKVKHQMSAPFCGECWQNYSRISGKEFWGVLGFLGCFFLGLFGLVLFESVFVMLVIFAVGIGLLIRGQMYKSKHSPKYKKINRREVIITDPLVGDVSFAK